MGIPAYLNMRGLRRPPDIRQVEVAECGLACIAIVLNRLGCDVDLAALRRRFAVSLGGATLKSLIEMSGKMGLSSRAVRCELEQLERLKTPAILHWNFNHFVVLDRVARGHVEIVDPVSGARRLTLAEASKHFTGIALELWPAEDFRREDERRKLKLGSLFRFPHLSRRSLGQALLLSTLIELFALCMPLYLQLVVDEAVSRSDFSLLLILATGFAALTLCSVVATAMRSLTLQFVSTLLSFDMQTRIFRHLLRLPLEWFHKRQVGDIQNRFGAIQPIQQFVTHGALAAVLDAVLGGFVLVLMFRYSALLGGVVLGSMFAYAGARALTMRRSRAAADAALVASGREQTRFLETVRAAHTIKAGAMETFRETAQRNAIADSLNANIRQGNIGILTAGLSGLISGIADIVVIFVGGKAIIDGQLSIGMLMAFLAYKVQFKERWVSVIEQVVSWRLLDVQLDRLSDIVMSDTEHQPLDGRRSDEIIGAIECRGTSFRYGTAERDVIRNLDLSIPAGEHVAITGPSGCGKSTLLRLITGLYQPTAGEILVDGQPIVSWNMDDLRARIAVVAQDDQLLAGSLAENISTFDDAIDMQRVEECARLASIHAEIQAMPMKYHSLVGDMGSILSGGQKQRVLIARALYRRPRVLIMDEGTSHLDVDNERAINESLAQLHITRVVVAHRPETIRAATRVLVLTTGPVGSCAVEVRPPAEPPRLHATGGG